MHQTACMLICLNAGNLSFNCKEGKNGALFYPFGMQAKKDSSNFLKTKI